MIGACDCHPEYGRSADCALHGMNRHVKPRPTYGPPTYYSWLASVLRQRAALPTTSALSARMLRKDADAIERLNR